MTPRWTAYFLHAKIGIYLKGNYIQPNIESSFPYTIVSRNCSFKIVSKIYFEFFCAISGAEKKSYYYFNIYPIGKNTAFFSVQNVNNFFHGQQTMFPLNLLWCAAERSSVSSLHIKSALEMNSQKLRRQNFENT